MERCVAPVLHHYLSKLYKQGCVMHLNVTKHILSMKGRPLLNLEGRQGVTSEGKELPS